MPRSRNKPSEYFALAVEISIIIRKLSMVKIYWFGYKETLKIFNIIACNHQNILPPPSRKICLYGKLTYFLLSTLFILLSILKYAYLIRDDLTQQLPLPFLTSMDKRLFLVFFLGINFWYVMHKNQSPFNYQKLFAVATLVSEFQREKFNTYLLLAALLPVLTLWLATVSFQDLFH